jgi:hypothetical protein
MLLTILTEASKLVLIMKPIKHRVERERIETGNILEYLRLVLQYLLFVMGEGQVANNPMAEIVRRGLGPDGPLAVIITSKKCQEPIYKT